MENVVQSNKAIVCHECSYNANPVNATHCEICGQQLQRDPIQPLPPAVRRFSRSWSQLAVLTLLLLLVLETGYLVWNMTWNRQSSGTALKPASAGCTAPASVKDRAVYTQICTAMNEVVDVPSGQFFYGGTMGAAALRSSGVLIDLEKAHPEFRLRYLDPLNVPPDSGTGIQMLINGDLSFAESQRPIREKEYELARSRGFTLKQIPVAITGVAFYVHPKLQIAGLSVAQVQDIITGKVTNWQQVGGPNLPLVPISQDFSPKGSTISLLLEGLPPERQQLSKNVQIVRDTTAAIRRVAATPGAIGYGTQAFVVNQKSIRLIGLAKGASRNYVQAATPEGQVNKDALRDGTYPLMQRVFVVIRQDGELDESAGEAYANLLLSNQGQKLVDKAGYLPIR
jgi:phosphate transport system substrate-binding protein